MLLDELDYWKNRTTTLQNLRRQARSGVLRRNDPKSLTRAAQILEYWRPLLYPYLRKLNHASSIAQYGGFSVPKDYPRGQHLKALAQTIRDPEKLPLIPPGMQKKGGPKVDLSLLVQTLLEICKGEIQAKSEGLVAYPEETELRKGLQPYIDAAQRTLLGLVSALVMAAFPEWFRGSSESP
jgi:hypothetical protein